MRRLVVSEDMLTDGVLTPIYPSPGGILSANTFGKGYKDAVQETLQHFGYSGVKGQRETADNMAYQPTWMTQSLGIGEFEIKRC